jgi:hypothetical protein
MHCAEVLGSDQERSRSARSACPLVRCPEGYLTTLRTLVRQRGTLQPWAAMPEGAADREPCPDRTNTLPKNAVECGVFLRFCRGSPGCFRRICDPKESVYKSVHRLLESDEPDRNRTALGDDVGIRSGPNPPARCLAVSGA